MERIPGSSKDTFIQFLSELLQAALGFTAYVAVLGFLVSTAIRSQNNIKWILYTTYPQQYLILGLTFLVFFAVYRVVPIVIALFLASVLTALIFAKSTYGKFRFIDSSSVGLELMYHLLFRHWLGRFTWILFALAGMVTAYFPEYIYPQTTTSAISPIAVIFVDNIDPNLWHLSVDAQNPRITQPLILLDELTDSLLVKDIGTGAIVRIKNEMIAGVIAVSPTPATTGSPTVSPIISPSPTP